MEGAAAAAQRVVFDDAHNQMYSLEGRDKRVRVWDIRMHRVLGCIEDLKYVNVLNVCVCVRVRVCVYVWYAGRPQVSVCLCGAFNKICEGNLGFFCRNLKIFCRNLGLFCRNVGFFCRNLELLCGNLGLFCRNVMFFS